MKAGRRQGLHAILTKVVSCSKLLTNLKEGGQSILKPLRRIDEDAQSSLDNLLSQAVEAAQINSPLAGKSPSMLVMNSLFTRHDKGKRGFIDRDAFGDILVELGIASDASDLLCEAEMVVADQDGDGKISRAEFENWWSLQR